MKPSSSARYSRGASQQHLRTGTTCLKVTDPHSNSHQHFREANLFRKLISTVPFILPLPPPPPFGEVKRFRRTSGVCTSALSPPRRFTDGGHSNKSRTNENTAQQKQHGTCVCEYELLETSFRQFTYGKAGQIHQEARNEF